MAVSSSRKHGEAYHEGGKSLKSNGIPAAASG